MKWKKALRDTLIMIGVLAAAILLSLVLSHIEDDNNPFAMPLFILAVMIIARYTDGYRYGIAAALIATFCVNFMFTYPFWTFDVTMSGYPLTFAVMLLVSVGVSTLMTRIKKGEQMRLEAEREKIHADLLRAMAHDIRTPLASIKGASSTLLEHDLPQEDRMALTAEIDREAEWLIRMTENLLTVTKMVGDDAKLKKDDEVLEEIIGSAIVKYRAREGALPVQVDMPDEILVVPVDATLIEQVMINLFQNVTDHARTATEIWVSIKREGNMAAVRVEDDGEGLSQQARQHLFRGNLSSEGGQRADDRRNMGIGLSVCRSIIRAHGGDLKAVTSSYGGAGFSFTLPCQEEIENVE